MAGRIQYGRKQFAKRWLYGGFGSINWFEHTTICEQSHHIAYKLTTEQYKEGKWEKGKTHMKPDFYHAKFVIFFGTGGFEANFGPPVLSNLISTHMINNNLKIVVVDPRFSKTASKAWKWIPVLPGKDAAFAWGMIRWILENEKYDKVFLSNANKGAAKSTNETSWSNATWLVKIEEDGPGKLLRGSDIGLGTEDHFVCVVNGVPRAFKTDDENNPVKGDLIYEGNIGGHKVKTAFKLIYDYAMSRSLEEWAKESGVSVDDLVEVSKEYAKYGKQSSVEFYRGPVEHTNGYYNGQVLITLNVLMGNIDWKGGLSVGGSHWHEDGGKPGNPFDLDKGMHPNKLTAFGVPITREKYKYEESSLFRRDKYPAKRPWFPLTQDVYQEVIPSLGDMYPYPIKALFLHKGTKVLASPAGQKMIDILVDLDKLPLFFACDIVVGETSMYADYIFPDTAIWERWGFPHPSPAVPTKASNVRQPSIDPVVEKVKVYGKEMPVSMEAIMLAIAEKLNLPGYGKDGFGKDMDFYTWNDYYLKMVANIAAGDKENEEVPDATEEEIKIFRNARKHLPKSIFNEEEWEKACIDEKGRNWFKKVIYVLNRGGRFEDFKKYLESGDKIPHPFKGQMNLYVEKTATTKHPYTGKRFSGIGIYEPVKGYDDKPIVFSDEYNFYLITFKYIQGGQSRNLPNNYWLSATLPENYILMNREDAEKMKIKPFEEVKIVSPTNQEGVWDLKNGRKVEVKGKVKIVEGMRPGTIAVSWSFGHWAYGASDIVINGRTIKGDNRRKAGLCANVVNLEDPVLKNVCLEDLIGGSSSFFDSKVKIVKV